MATLPFVTEAWTRLEKPEPNEAVTAADNQPAIPITNSPGSSRGALGPELGALVVVPKAPTERSIAVIVSTS